MSHSTPDEPNLFDLPLAPPPAEAMDAELAAEETPSEEASPRGGRGRRRRSERPAAPESLSLFEEPEESLPPRASRAERAGLRPLPRVSEPSDEAPDEVSLAARARAAAGDLVVLAAVGAIAASGARALGAPIGAGQIAPLLVFLLSWSFLYTVIALAFWGQTPGMAWVGVVARSADGEPLSFGQTALRWIGIWLTWALAGIPGLLALTGASLADRLSRSRLYESPEAFPAREASA